eukprot:comp18138_c0_seq1/m.18871 comp18138_c0_seq1/g.18871  ORF comp18138_c0_seq1/g.18871 comp18138_c0_seq1/m.18871 type:complete len:134 (-) comp18138_c0_seq1:486-887(-)
MASSLVRQSVRQAASSIAARPQANTLTDGLRRQLSATPSVLQKEAEWMGEVERLKTLVEAARPKVSQAQSLRDPELINETIALLGVFLDGHRELLDHHKEDADKNKIRSAMQDEIRFARGSVPRLILLRSQGL